MKVFTKKRPTFFEGRRCLPSISSIKINIETKVCYDNKSICKFCCFYICFNKKLPLYDSTRLDSTPRWLLERSTLDLLHRQPKRQLTLGHQTGKPTKKKADLQLVQRKLTELSVDCHQTTQWQKSWIESADDRKKVYLVRTKK